MTHKRDRIQENANKYIVKNCPACMVNPMFSTPDYFCNDIAIEERILHCDSRTDCVIKQVIGVCKREAVTNYPKKEKEFITVNGYRAILNMFDIEEINK